VRRSTADNGGVDREITGADGLTGRGSARGLVASPGTIGRAAGIVITLASTVTLVTLHLLAGVPVPAWFDVLNGGSAVAGVVCVLAPWDRISTAWLHLIPILGTLVIAVGIHVIGAYGDIAANYYIFVAVFAAYAFSSRRAVAGYVAFAAAASSLTLFYPTARVSHPPAQVAIGILTLVVIAGIITVLREGLQARQRRLEELAVRDPLTGVGNYRLLTERLDYEIARHRRSGACLSVVLFDLDGFKEINDTLGHQVGDRVLVDVARALSGCVREHDTVARQGGDEFSIIAPETDAEQVWQLAARAQEAVSAMANGCLSTGVGVATFPTEAADSDRLLALADADLRRNKQGLRPRERNAEPSTRTVEIGVPFAGLAVGEPTGQPLLAASAGTG
jgi:diguanylate cyclase (GGDEF)-like protein